jgi:hypothetical protein
MRVQCVVADVAEETRQVQWCKPFGPEEADRVHMWSQETAEV